MVEPKQLKVEENSEITTINMDRISSLPDALRCHILSFLPTKESVATSILSRSWHHTWKDLQVFTFEEDSFSRDGLSVIEVYEHFVAFVDAVLEQRRFPNIKEFSLVCDVIEQNIFTTWICKAIGSHLQELFICLQDVVAAKDIILPDSLFTCTSLVSLSLHNMISYLYNLPVVHLPSLKNLELSISYEDFVVIDNLLHGCSVLEKLMVIFFTIYAPTICMPRTLRSLYIEEEYSSEIDTIKCLEIVTPSLEFLHIIIRTPCLKIVVCDFANMVEARLNISPNNLNAGWVPELLKALCSAKLLVLHESTTECLLHAPVLDLPEFRRLVNLKIKFSRFNSSFLMNMLGKCHMLQVLTICKEKASHTWIQPTNVPNCLVSNLIIVNFSVCHGSKEDQEFIAYILQNGLVLATVTILFSSIIDSKKKRSICEELSLVPRGSKMCQLTFEN